MAFLDDIREAARLQLVRGLDDWYYQEFPYVLELRGYGLRPDVLPGPSVYFTFPLGPEEYSTQRVYRQSVTPTMGGTIAEEGGLLWVEFHIRGTFGMSVKSARDGTQRPDPPIGPGSIFVGGGLSGPGWTRRMIRNIFDRYAELKADPKTAGVRMIWHDMKTDEHWVVVPETVSLPRTKARRAQYPYDIQMKGIARASDIALPGSQGSLKGFGKVKQVLASVNKAVTMVRAAIQEGSEVLREIRFFAQQIDSVVGNLITLSDAADDFLNGVTDTISVGRVFMLSTADLLQTTLDAMETATEIPASVRANYQMALDGLYLMIAQIAAYGKTYEQEIEALQATEQGAASDDTATLARTAEEGPATSLARFAQRRERQDDQSLVDAGATNRARIRGSYTGFREYAVQRVDTLQSIAAQQLGDGALWYDIALVNGLKAPYISPAKPPGTVQPGDIIVIPIVGGADRTTAVVAGEGRSTGQDLLGTDIELTEDSNSLPGSPTLVIQIDQRTLRDCKVVSGIDNFKQALQLRMWTEQGRMPLVPLYGRPRQVGVKQVAAFLTLLRLSTAQTIRQDSRVQALRAVRFTQTDDLVEIDADVVPIGSANSQNVTLSVV